MTLLCIVLIGIVMLAAGSARAQDNPADTIVPRLRQVLLAMKVARYLQIENKIRAVLKYDLATQIPLAR